MKYRVLIEQDEDGGVRRDRAPTPGCVSQGATRDDARRNIREAITGYLKRLEEHGDPIPPGIEEEVVEVVSTRQRTCRLGRQGCQGVSKDQLSV